MNDPELGMSVRLTETAIVVTLPILTIEMATPYALDQHSEGWTVVDARAFARAVLLELEAEQEDGTTIVAEMFDEVFRRAVDNGADGIEEPTPAPPRGQRWTRKTAVV